MQIYTKKMYVSMYESSVCKKIYLRKRDRDTQRKIKTERGLCFL